MGSSTFMQMCDASCMGIAVAQCNCPKFDRNKRDACGLGACIEFRITALHCEEQRKSTDLESICMTTFDDIRNLGHGQTFTKFDTLCAFDFLGHRVYISKSITRQTGDSSSPENVSILEID